MVLVNREFNGAIQTLSLFLHIVIFIFGLVLNLTLIIISALEKEVPTPQNITIFNIKSTNIMSIIGVFTSFISPSKKTEMVF